LRGIISPAYVVMRLRSSQVPRYLHYLYRTPQFAKEAERWSYGITSDMWSLRPEHFKMIYTALPPLDEQAAIVKFLDYANGKIERAIRAKRKLIGLLNEQKQAIIHRAVTRGRDPNVKLKPSGIPWLGDVPEHWDVMRGKYLGRLFSTPSVMDNELTEDSDGNAMYLKVSDLAGADDSFRLTRSRLYAKRSMPRETTRRSMIVFPKRGGAIYTNKVAIVESACLVDPNLMCWAISERFDPHYVALLLKTRTLADLADVSSVPQINNHHINPVPFPAPPVAEQTSIVAGLERDLAGVNSAVSRVDRELELLREYRTTLTAEVVTGKLDVREVAKRLPDQTDEPLPPDESLDEMVDDEII